MYCSAAAMDSTRSSCLMIVGMMGAETATIGFYRAGSFGMLTGDVALAGLWRGLGGEESALSAVELTGAEPALPSSFAIGTAAQASIAAATLAAREIARERGGPTQTVYVDMRHAAIAFRSERYLRVDGAPAPELWDKIAGAYRCADGWVRLHTNFAHHRDGVLRLLGCANERSAVQDALMSWRGEGFETAAAEAGLVVTALRSFEQWTRTCRGRPSHRCPCSVSSASAMRRRSLCRPGPQTRRNRCKAC